MISMTSQFWGYVEDGKVSPHGQEQSGQVLPRSKKVFRIYKASKN